MPPLRAYLAMFSCAEYTRSGGIFLSLAQTIFHQTSLILGLVAVALVSAPYMEVVEQWSELQTLLRGRKPGDVRRALRRVSPTVRAFYEITAWRSSHPDASEQEWAAVWRSAENTGLERPMVAVWDLSNGVFCVGRIKGEDKRPLSFGPHSRLLATTSGTDEIAIYRVKSAICKTEELDCR